MCNSWSVPVWKPARRNSFIASFLVQCDESRRWILLKFTVKPGCFPRVNCLNCDSSLSLSLKKQKWNKAHDPKDKTVYFFDAMVTLHRLLLSPVQSVSSRTISSPGHRHISGAFLEDDFKWLRNLREYVEGAFFGWVAQLSEWLSSTAMQYLIFLTASSLLPVAMSMDSW